jgi:hypothetical protein
VAVTFNGPELRIELTAVGSYDAQIDLYSDWKEWTQVGANAKFPKAFDTTGGDDTGEGQFVAPYFFLRNDLGWRIAAPEADGEITILGNLFARDPNLAAFLPPAGDYTVLILQKLSTQAIVVETGTSGLTPEEAANLARLDVNVSTRGTDDGTADAVWNKTLP